MAEKVFDAVLDQLDDVLGFVDEQLDLVDCPMKTRMQVQIAVEEIFVNIASYAYQPGTGTADILVETAKDPRSVTITFRDRGVPYDPLAKEDPDISLSAEDRPIGGLGIYMTKKTMDEMKYEYRDGQNVLTIRKMIA